VHSILPAVVQAGAACRHVPAQITQAARNPAAPAASPGPAPGPGSPPAASAGDKFTAAPSARTRSLAPGRAPRSDVRPGQLSSRELIRSLAGDLTVPSGRHAGPSAGLTGAAR
jgi:hypothetical protein